MIESLAATRGMSPAWLPLLQRPYENIFGAKNVWDLRMADGTAVRIERSSQGLSNSAYRVRFGGNVYTCKLFISDERQRAQREWAALCSLHEVGLHLAPEPIAYAPDGPLPQPAIVCRWVNGETLAGQGLTQGDLTALVSRLNLIHHTPPATGIEPMLAWHQPENFAAYLAEIREAIDKVRAWAASSEATARDLPVWVADLPALLPIIGQALQLAEEAVAGARSDGKSTHKALVRVDGNLENIVRDADSQIVFLDWEYSGWGDCAYDLAELRWHPRAQGASSALWESALRTYVPAPGDTSFEERLRVFCQLLPVWWVGRSIVHLLEGADKLTKQSRVVRVPARMYQAARKQLDGYLAALGLIALAEEAETEEEE